MVGAKHSRLEFSRRLWLHDKCKLNVEASCAARANASATRIEPSIRKFRFFRQIGGTAKRPMCHCRLSVDTTSTAGHVEFSRMGPSTSGRLPVLCPRSCELIHVQDRRSVVSNKKLHYRGYLLDQLRGSGRVFKIKRVLVTGGAGFLGSHLCERLVGEGHDVICLDNFFTSQKTNVQHLLGEPNFELIRHDVTMPIWLEVDEIYNLACPAAPGHYQYNAIKTIKTSVLGAINVLGMAKRCRAKVLQASTSEVYGDPEVHPQPESYRGSVNPIGPRACYDEGKRAAETLFMDYHRMNNVNVRIVRIFNTYGPRMHPFDGRVISNFIRQALAGEDITLFGEGDQTRSFCYRDDLIEGFIRLMNADDEVTGPVNIGNPGEFTIRQLAELVIKMTDSSSKIVKRPLPLDDPTRRRPDISLAKEKLGWEPTVALEEGLAKTIDWFRSIDLGNYRPPTPNF